LLRIGETALIAVFDDSQACASAAYETLRKIAGPLSPLQLREISVRMGANNIYLAERPRFKSEFDFVSEAYSIGGVRPAEIRFSEWSDEVVGQLMTRMCSPFLFDTPDKPQIIESLKTGLYTFVLNDRGEFNATDMDLAPPDE